MNEQESKIISQVIKDRTKNETKFGSLLAFCTHFILCFCFHLIRIGLISNCKTILNRKWCWTVQITRCFSNRPETISHACYFIVYTKHQRRMNTMECARASVFRSFLAVCKFDLNTVIQKYKATCIVVSTEHKVQ